MIVTGESREAARKRREAGAAYDWALGEAIAWTPDEGERAENERRMAERYRAWEAGNIVTYTFSKYESAFRTYRNAQFETVNPIDDTVKLPEPRYDEKAGKWVVPKNVFDGNVLSRRRFLFEIDGMEIRDQRAVLEPLLRRGVVQRVVFSGNKSLHCVIEEEDEPETNEQYKWVWHYMAREFFRDMRFHCLRLPLKVDRAFPEVVDSNCSNPSRTTRSPFAVRRDEKTGPGGAEQKLLYFEDVRADSGWRKGWEKVKGRYEAELERTRRQARREAWKYRDREKKTPNEAARRFMGGDMSDGWKHASLGSAVASLKACGYSREEVAGIFGRYERAGKRELLTFAMRAYDYFEMRDRGKAVEYFTRKNGPTAEGLAEEALG
jgi:hypothetical protein